MSRRLIGYLGRSMCHPVVVGVAIFALWVPAAAAQEARVLLKVSADDKLKTELHRHLEDGLRLVPSVSLSGDVAGADFTISVIALKVVTRSSKDMGLAVSVVITAPMRAKLKQFAERRLSPELRDELSAVSSDGVTSLAHWVEIASAGQLKQVSASIIETFIKDVLPLAKKTASPGR